ncbi:MAG: hypothetical protein Q8942_05530 [Bacillota bacterium]|nr:hypothetical protein [Bacillota bacterium]
MNLMDFPNKFKIILFEGTDSIKFGMTSEEIQLILLKKPKIFKKIFYIPYDTENYDICHVYYEPNEEGKLVCGAIEFMPEAEVYINDIKLLGMGNKTAFKIFKDIFPDSEQNVDTYRSAKSCISLFSFKHKVSTIYITRKGYEENFKKVEEKAFREYMNTKSKERVNE